jgi:hypothetical protein
MLNLGEIKLAAATVRRYIHAVAGDARDDIRWSECPRGNMTDCNQAQHCNACNQRS